MDKPIKTYEDLLKEKKNLQHQIALQKGNIKYDIEGIKSAMKPASMAYGVFGKFFSRKPYSPALVTISKLITAFILGKIIKKKKGGIIRKISALFLANFITLSIKPVVLALNNFLLNKFKPIARPPVVENVRVKLPY
ncbi:MAG: hypothetical protein H0V30_14755 [Chitinophagaceae bacterium]|jgi:hypothetical protein|nr:hypothetical protein [Chitinophagaceae bacterium]